MANKVLLVIMDGVGISPSHFGNAFHWAKKPNIDWLLSNSLSTQLCAHGTYVGMPQDSDLGNSEVGHNAIGAGRIVDQGAKLVNYAVESGQLFGAEPWQEIMSGPKVSASSALHFIGLLSDGNVHSHEKHLFSLIEKSIQSGVRTIRLHMLLDGRDVGQKSAKTYLARLNTKIAEWSANSQVDICVASGGGRMIVTMDRYEADWRIVERGWNAHVHHNASDRFTNIGEAVDTYYERGLTDQNFPAFIVDCTHGDIRDGDSVVFFNFRGDRAIELSRAFDETEFPYFDRGKIPKVVFAGMMQYDGDKQIPHRFLVPPPAIKDTLGEYLSQLGLRQFACSETQKFGHVTYFWNGNRSGKFSDSLERYIEVSSDRISFDLAPAMKCKEIADLTISQIKEGWFDFARINFANGDMVGHTGDFDAAVQSVESVDVQIGRLIDACRSSETILVVTADHGNCEEMFDANPADYPDWKPGVYPYPRAKTAHTTNPVPLIVFDPQKRFSLFESKSSRFGLANLANTVLTLMGCSSRKQYLPGVVEPTNEC